MGTQIQAPFKRLIGENGELTRGVPAAQKDGQVQQYFSPREKTQKERHGVQEKDNGCLLDRMVPGN